MDKNFIIDKYDQKVRVSFSQGLVQDGLGYSRRARILLDTDAMNSPNNYEKENALAEAFDVVKKVLNENWNLIKNPVDSKVFFEPYNFDNEETRKYLTGKTVQRNNGYFIITGFLFEDFVWFAIINNDKVLNKELFDNWKFPDGNYCGVLKEIQPNTEI